MNERIKEVRTALKLSRAAFGEQLGCSGDVINNAERGRAALTDMFIMHICKTFNVNEEWLRTGNGEMFLALTVSDEIAAFTAQASNLSEDDPRVKILQMMANLPEEDWKAIAHMIDLLKNNHR